MNIEQETKTKSIWTLPFISWSCPSISCEYQPNCNNSLIIAATTQTYVWPCMKTSNSHQTNYHWIYAAIQNQEPSLSEVQTAQTTIGSIFLLFGCLELSWKNINVLSKFTLLLEGLHISWYFKYMNYLLLQECLWISCVFIALKHRMQVERRRGASHDHLT